MAKLIDPTHVSSNDLADILGVTRSAVSKLHAAGVIKQNGKARGKYNLFDTVHAYRKYILDNRMGEEQFRLVQQRERKIRIQNNRVEAELVPIDEVAKVFAAYARQMRAVTNSRIPGLAVKLAKATTPLQARKIFYDEINSITETTVNKTLKVFENDGTS